MDTATLGKERAHDLDKAFRKALGELVSEYLGDGLQESVAVEALQEEVSQINNYD